MFFTQLQAQWPPVAQLSLCHATDVRIVRLSAMSTKLCAEIVILSWVRCNGTLRILKRIPGPQTIAEWVYNSKY
jgi:hypothetical protein